MDLKSWAFMISVLAFVLSLITFFKTNLWFSLKFNLRLISFKWSFNSDKESYICKFLLSCSGNQNVYVDRIYLNEGSSKDITETSKSIDVLNLLTPGEIKEFVYEADSSWFKHGRIYTFVITLISPNADQFHSYLVMSTKHQKGNSLIILPEQLGGSMFALHSFNLIKMFNLRNARKRRNKNK